MLSKSASMLSSSSPARRALREPALEVGPERAVRGQGVVGEGPGHEGADAGTSGDETFELELAIGLRHRVGVDRELADDVLHRRQLVTLGEQAEPQGAAYLLDELLVRRDAGPAVEVELDHRQTPFH